VITLLLSRDALPEAVALKEGDAVLLRAGDHGNVKAVSFSCRGEVVSRTGRGELRVRCLEEVKSDEVREFFRLGTEISATLFNLSTSGGNPLENGAPAVQGSVARIVNISGGGIRTETTMATADGDIVYATFHLPLPEPKSVPVVAQVVHSEQINGPGGPLYSTGLRYLHINERDRDSIVRYVCNEEIRRIRLCRKDFLSLP
jgi:c-di-GMP-binding flagellar brake protein YcgR